jgi:hypothetical protein
MFRILDRYLVREILLPFAIGLVVLTFVMMMPPILDQGRQLIEKGVDLVTFVRILLTITPSALCITIPMALLFAILMGLGRLSSDREFRRDAGLWRQHFPRAAADRGAGGAGLCCRSVRDAGGAAERQPDLPGNHLQRRGVEGRNRC